MRTLTDFRKMHLAWVAEVIRIHGGVPPLYASIELTAEEFCRLRSTYAFQRENTPGKRITMYGHPLRISHKPAIAISIPTHI